MPRALPIADIARALDDVRARCRTGERLARDPVGAVRGYADPQDAEIAALVAACIAFGNVTTIRAKLADALARLGPHPAALADEEARVHRAMRGWVHRVFRGEDIARLVVGARVAQREQGSLGHAFARDLGSERRRPPPRALRLVRARPRRRRPVALGRAHQASRPVASSPRPARRQRLEAPPPLSALDGPP